MDIQDRKCLTMLKREKWDDCTFNNINISDFFNYSNFFPPKNKIFLCYINRRI